MNQFTRSVIFCFVFMTSVVQAEENIPSADQLRAALQEAYQLFRSENSGKLTNYTDVVPKADPNLFGITIITVNGDVYEVGNSRDLFAIQSICKPFVFGLALEDHGHVDVLHKIGVEPTGLPYNSIIAIEITHSHKQNPNVNAGAIATASLIKGKDGEERFDRTLEMFKKYIGRKPQIDPLVLQSEKATSATNQALGTIMKSLGLMYGDLDDAIDRYLKGCSLSVNSYDLALMGACLANDGLNPMTNERTLQEKYIRDVLSVMLISGMYDYSGHWMYEVGLPAKSGIGGGILIVVPGQFGIGVFSPLLNGHGNSVRGLLVAKYLSKKFRLHLLDPRPAKENWVPSKEYKK